MHSRISIQLTLDPNIRVYHLNFVTFEKLLICGIIGIYQDDRETNFTMCRIKDREPWENIVKCQGVTKVMTPSRSSILVEKNPAVDWEGSEDSIEPQVISFLSSYKSDEEIDEEIRIDHLFAPLKK